MYVTCSSAVSNKSTALSHTIRLFIHRSLFQSLDCSAPSIGRSVGRSIDRSIGRSVSWSVDRSSVDRLVGRSRSVGLSIDRSVYHIRLSIIRTF